MISSRRNFLSAATAAVAGLTVSAARAEKSAVATKSEVIVGKGSAAEVIPKILRKLGGIGRFVKPDSRVVIKPNMSFANPADWGTTTSPEAVYAVVKLCVEAGAKRIIVCDNTLRDPELCKQKTGIPDAIREFKAAVVFVPKQDTLFEEKTHGDARQLTRTSVVKEVLRADALISLPAAKSHSASGVSLGLKGLMGLIKDRDLFHREMDLHRAIAEQLYYIRPHVTIVDATRALVDNGPGGPGKVVDLKTFVGGLDPVAVDSFAVTLASWYGKQFEGKQVQHLRHAAELGFGNVESSRISEIAV